ncbi:MAG TPA: hypothetical protein VF727_16385 [Allosphingosinicella sp.]
MLFFVAAALFLLAAAIGFARRGFELKAGLGVAMAAVMLWFGIQQRRSGGG